MVIIFWCRLQVTHLDTSSFDDESILTIITLFIYGCWIRGVRRIWIVMFGFNKAGALVNWIIFSRCIGFLRSIIGLRPWCIVTFCTTRLGKWTGNLKRRLLFDLDRLWSMLCTTRRLPNIICDSLLWPPFWGVDWHCSPIYYCFWSLIIHRNLLSLVFSSIPIIFCNYVFRFQCF